MESFNKNWLAIILIVIVFTSIGFLFGRICESGHHSCKENKMWRMHEKRCNTTEPFTMEFPYECCDSMKNIDVRVMVNENGEVIKECQGDSIKTKFIVKKIH